MAQQSALNDAIELLNGDHREIESLLATLVVASTAERSELVTALIRELNVHTKEAPVAQRSSSRSRRPVHVVPHAGQWAVRREGASRVSSVHSTQAAAEKQGRAIAKRQKVEFELHGRDGEIRARDSYGHDPRSSKG